MSRPNLGAFSRKPHKNSSIQENTQMSMDTSIPDPSSESGRPTSESGRPNFFSANKWRIIGGAGLLLVGFIIGTSGGNSPTDSEEYKNLDASYTAVQSDLKSVKTTIAGLEKDIQKKESTIKELESSKKTLEAEQGKWKDQAATVKEKETKIAELDGKITSLTSERDTCQANLASATTSEAPPAQVADTAPEPEPVNVYYRNCSAARAAGAAPVYAGSPGYGSHLDRDGDGIGCE